jgi:hypothetical protein
MVKISISELSPAGSELFSDSESFVSSMTELSAAELKLTGGGGHGGGSKKKGSGSGSKKKGSNKGSGGHGKSYHYYHY